LTEKCNVTHHCRDVRHVTPTRLHRGPPKARTRAKRTSQPSQPVRNKTSQLNGQKTQITVASKAAPCHYLSGEHSGASAGKPTIAKPGSNHASCRRGCSSPPMRNSARHHCSDSPIWYGPEPSIISRDVAWWHNMDSIEIAKRQQPACLTTCD
jgi:hypothetical protein